MNSENYSKRHRELQQSRGNAKHGVFLLNYNNNSGHSVFSKYEIKNLAIKKYIVRLPSHFSKSNL